MSLTKVSLLIILEKLFTLFAIRNSTMSYICLNGLHIISIIKALCEGTRIYLAGEVFFPNIHHHHHHHHYLKTR